MKPMLAATLDSLDDLEYPMLASPKLDGIRAMVIDGVLMSRKLKPIPNPHVQKMFGIPELEGLDGELIMGDPCDPAAFRKTTSAVMSRSGEPEVVFWVFDDLRNPSAPFQRRLRDATQTATRHPVPTDPVTHITVNNREELLQLEDQWLAMGYEGVMLRDPQGKYKFGRSTLRERGLIKLKRFEDAEAKVLYLEEQQENTNEATRDALGKIKRSNHKAGMKGKDTLGALRVEGINGTFKGVEFSVGSGFDDALRKKIWDNPGQYVGTIIKYKFFPGGSKDAPRFPTYLGLRED